MQKMPFISTCLFLCLFGSRVVLSEPIKDSRVELACKHLLKEQYVEAEKLLRNPQTAQEKGLYAVLLAEESIRKRKFGLTVFNVERGCALAKEALPNLQAEENGLNARILGLLYYNGIGVKKDDKKAFDYSLRAADMNEPMGMGNVGLCYLNGIGVDKDSDKGVKWLNSAAKRGNTMARLSLSSLYKEGNLVSKNPMLAKSMLIRAANQGNSRAMLLLAVNALTTEKSNKDEVATNARERRRGRDKTTATRDRRKNRRPNAKSKEDLDLARGKKWLEQSADSSFIPAMTVLASLFETGSLGYEKNEEKALEWYKKAAQSGLASPLFEVARCCERGMGTSIDLGSALLYYEKANQAAKQLGDEEILKKTTQRLAAQLVLLDWRWTRESGFVTAEGQVRSVTPHKLENVSVTVIYKTSSGALVTSDTVLIEYNPLMPGQLSPFKVITSDNPQIRNANVNFSFLMGGSIPFYYEQ
jgi:TPR repeat protein